MCSSISYSYNRRTKIQLAIFNQQKQQQTPRDSERKNGALWEPENVMIKIAMEGEFYDLIQKEISLVIKQVISNNVHALQNEGAAGRERDGEKSTLLQMDNL